MIVSKKELIGKRAWTIQPSILKSKMFDCFTYFGIFMGVILVSFSVLSSSINLVLFITGCILPLLSVFIRDRRSSIKVVVAKPWLRYTLQLFSIIGMGLLLGGLATLIVEQSSNTWIFIFSGVILSLVSRFNSRKISFQQYIKDYVTYLGSFLGVFLACWGLSMLQTYLLPSLGLILLGVFLTPTVLLLREKMTTRRKANKIKRKFLSITAVTIGTCCSAFGVYSLFSGDWLAVLLFPYGLILLAGGAIFNENRTLLVLKDLI
jgi:hypothetical protein